MMPHKAHSSWKKAQQTFEYALLVAIVAGAVLGMQAYMKRGLQGRLKEIIDPLGEDYDPENTTTWTTRHYDVTVEAKNDFYGEDTLEGEDDDMHQRWLGKLSEDSNPFSSSND